MTIESLNLWHKRARPEPTEESFNVQLGCHLEEVVEMLGTLYISEDGDNSDEAWNARVWLNVCAEKLKSGEYTATIGNRKELLDSLADQIVTAVGVAHCAKMDIVAACEEVNKSNWSKFNYKGFPEFNENGKIKKGSQYRPPNLEGMY
jgi:predicted HAD superfamily Cof-like phosphohydrolase